MEELVLEIKKDRDSLGLKSFRSIPIDEKRSKIEVNDRLVKGYAIVWGTVNSFQETVVKGATLNSLNARGVGSEKNSIVLLKHHNTTQPIGSITVLREDEYGLYFEAEIVDTALGNETIEEVRSGVLKQLSYGFNYIWDKTEWDEESQSYVLKEIRLMEISLVTFSSDENAQLRSFSDYQENTLAKQFTVEQLRSIADFANKELSSRDEHLNSEAESEEITQGKVTIF
jgi:hypothetical protein